MEKLLVHRFIKSSVLSLEIDRKRAEINAIFIYHIKSNNTDNKNLKIEIRKTLETQYKTHKNEISLLVSNRYENHSGQ